MATCTRCGYILEFQQDVPSLLYQCGSCNSNGEMKGRRRWFCANCKVPRCLDCVRHPSFGKDTPNYDYGHETIGGYKSITYGYLDEYGHTHGPSTVYSMDRKLIVDGYYVHGKRHGTCTLYFDDGSSLKVNCIEHNIQGQCVYTSADTKVPENFDSRSVELNNKHGNWSNPSYRAAVQKELKDLIATTKNVIKVDAEFKDVTTNQIIQQGCFVDCSLTFPGPSPQVSFTLSVANKFFYRSEVLPKPVKDYNGEIILTGGITYPENYLPSKSRKIQIPITTHDQQHLVFALFPKGSNRKDPLARSKFTSAGDKEPVIFSLSLGGPSYSISLKDAFTEDGKPYDGPVQVVALTITDPSSISSLEEFPSFEGKMTADGESVTLETFGAIKLQLQTDDGRVIVGKTLIRFPSSRVKEVMGTKPATFPIWTLEGLTWLFLCDGEYEEETDSYVAEPIIRGSSFVNLDRPFNFTGSFSTSGGSSSYESSPRMRSFSAEVHVALRGNPKKSVCISGGSLSLLIHQQGVGSLFRAETNEKGVFDVTLQSDRAETRFSFNNFGRNYSTVASTADDAPLSRERKIVFVVDRIEVNTSMGRGEIVNLPTVNERTIAVKLQWGAVGYFQKVVVADFLSFQ